MGRKKWKDGEPVETGRGVLILPSYYEALRSLPDDMRLALYDAMLDFGFCGTEPDGLGVAEKAIFTLIRPSMERAIEKYEAQYKNGCKGGRPKTQAKPNNNPTETQAKPNGNQDKDKDKEKDKENRESKADKPPRAPRFSPPTVEEVEAYCRERQNGIDPERFVDFYASKGWKVGSQTMKDWKAAVRTWEKRELSESRRTGMPPDISDPKYYTYSPEESL